MTDERAKRPYRKVARAQNEADTRRRITEATVELHGSVGPANTRVTDIAKLAGVSRMTVYTHFPTEADLFRACSAHWAALHPFPDPSEWRPIITPSERLRRALHETYSWYRENRGMLSMIFRDIGSVPSLSEVMGDVWAPYLESCVEVITSGRRLPARDAKSLSALVRWGIDFPSWVSLTESGLSDSESASLVSRVVEAAFPDM